jgi:hypothetical protein
MAEKKIGRQKARRKPLKKYLVNSPAKSRLVSLRPQSRGTHNLHSGEVNMPDGNILATHSRKAISANRKDCSDVPQFTVGIYTPATCKCCGVPQQPGQKAQAFVNIDAVLQGYQERAGHEACRGEVERQCTATLNTYHEAQAKKPAIGDAFITASLKTASKLYRRGNTMAEKAKGNDWSVAEREWENARQHIRKAARTRATGIVGVAAKLAYIELALGDGRDWHGGYYVEEMTRAAHRDMQTLLLRGGAK